MSSPSDRTPVRSEGEPAHRAAAESKRAIEEIVCRIAREAGAADPQALAQDLCLVMEGAYVTRHVTHNPATIAIARRVAECVIAGHLDAAAESAGRLV